MSELLGSILRATGSGLIGGRDVRAGARAAIDAGRLHRQDLDRAAREEDEARYESDVEAAAGPIAEQLGVSLEQAEALIRTGQVGEVGQFALDDRREVRKEEREQVYAAARDLGFSGGDLPADLSSDPRASSGYTEGRAMRVDAITSFDTRRRQADAEQRAIIESDLPPEQQAAAIDRVWANVDTGLDAFSDSDPVRGDLLESISTAKMDGLHMIEERSVDQQLQRATTIGEGLDGIQDYSEDLFEETGRRRELRDGVLNKLAGYGPLLDFDEQHVPDRARPYLKALRDANGDPARVPYGAANSAFANLGSASDIISEANRKRQEDHDAVREQASAQALKASLKTVDDILGTGFAQEYGGSLDDARHPGQAAQIFNSEVVPEISRALDGSPGAAVTLTATLGENTPPSVRKAAVAQLDQQLEVEGGYGAASTVLVRDTPDYQAALSSVMSGIEIGKAPKPPFVNVPRGDTAERARIEALGAQILGLGPSGTIQYRFEATSMPYEAVWKTPVTALVGKYESTRRQFADTKIGDLEGRARRVSANIDERRELGLGTASAERILSRVERDIQSARAVESFNTTRAKNLGRLAVRLAALPDPDEWQSVLKANSSITESALSSLSTILPTTEELAGIDPDERIRVAGEWLEQHASLVSQDEGVEARRAVVQDFRGYIEHLRGVYIDLGNGWDDESAKMVRRSRGAPSGSVMFKAKGDDPKEDIALLSFLHNAML